MRLSVVIASWNGEQSLAACLQAVREQASVDTEILVVSNRGAVAGHGDGISDAVQYVDAGADKTVPELRASGLSIARGQIIALTEDHCVPRPGWMASLLKEHALGHQVVAGNVENGRASSLFDWAVFLFDYSAFLPGMGHGPQFSATNVSFRRETLESLRSSWTGGFIEYEVEAALKARQIALFASSSMTVTHIGHYERRAATHKFFLGGRFFGGTRRERTGIPERIFRILAAPVIPLVLVLRIGFRILTRPTLVRKYLLSLPSLTMLAIAWSLGELVGYVSGKGASSSHWK